MAVTKKRKRLSVTVDPSLCMGCCSCEIACAVAHSASKELYEVIRSGETPGHRINVESCRGQAVPIHCNHCEEAACIEACPTGAIFRKAKGFPVLVDKDRCIGCSMCVQACPFGVITLDPSGKGVLKCDLCVERLAQGKEPACVAACPTHALALEDAEDANEAKRQRAAARIVAAQETGDKESS